MSGIRFQPGHSNPRRGMPPEAAGPERADSRPANGPGKGGLPPLGPGLGRVDSNPARLPSNLPERTQIKPDRPQITRALPDAEPPKAFEKPPRKFCGIPIPSFKSRAQKTKEAALQKAASLASRAESYETFKDDIRRDDEYREIIEARHPDFMHYGKEKKAQAFGQLSSHPRFRAEVAKARNEMNSIPNGATGSRKMRRDEQIFLANAFKRINAEARSNPFHIHGESAIVGNKKGEITQFNYSPKGESHAKISKGDRYHLHTHPPFMEPFTSSASEADHGVAIRLYMKHDNRMDMYVTNGKDVLHIRPDSTELVKLIPDPKLEKKLGAFPEGFRLPEPRQPPYPFTNHEAPAAAPSRDSRTRDAGRPSGMPRPD